MNGHATINRFYRLIWSEKQGAWVAVAENVRGRGKSSGRGAFMAALFAGLGLAPFAWAGPPGANQLPTGGQVVGGAATITQSGSQMTINQASQRGAIDWQTFNLGSQAQVNFQQPNSGSVTLNRVQDSQASQIFGRITANGQVFLSNPNGVYFSPTSSVNVGGLVATTHAIGTAEFMAGSNTFERNGATGSVINDGSLNASLGGYIALLAPQVRNNGIVIAQAGTVAMAAGEQISLQFADSRTLAGVLVSPSTIAALVENGSAVQAPGGMIIMSAQAANDLQGGVVRNTGSVAATGLASRGGKIVLDSTGLVDNSGSLDASGAPGGKGKVTISGERMASSGAVRADGGGTISSTLTHGLVETASAVISAQGGGNITVDGGAGKVYTSGNYNADGEQGGKVVITANEVALMGAKVSATGVSQGGAILIGGDYQGKNADVHNAAKTSVGAGVTLNADATGNGNGGKVVVWSDEKTVFAGELTARGGAAGGDGGILEVSGKETLYFGGKADAHAAKGKSGALLLDPKDIYIDSDLSGQLELVDPHPTAGGSFGKLNAPLTTTSGSTATRTGYIVVTNPNDNLGATNSGAAYLFRQSDQALISTLYGTHAGDKVGSNGVTSLTNGNYVVSSNLWNGGMGAVTWGNGTTGWGASALAVSSSNSLVGSHATHKSTMNQDTSDNIGAYAITVLNNGNYLVGTPSWSDNRGALTFGNGSTGVAGIVSSANSLVGSTAMTVVPADGYKRYKSGDLVGSGVTVLANNNYVMANENWNKGVGAVTFASGTTGIKGVVGTSNSLIGDSSRFDSTGAGTGTDKVGSRVMVLTGSQFVVYGSDWKNSSGALTSFDGVTAITGLVSASNSLVGTAGDSLSSGGLTLLPSNNAFVISSPSWNGGRGAATWVPFSTDVKTVSVATNGVVGANAGDSVGSKAIALLANNDYVVISPNWSSGKGAATLVDGTTGKAKADQSGNVSASTSLVGAQANDVVGSNGILELKGNGNYVVLSPYWANGSNTKAGAVTWSSGSTPTVGVVGTSNSLVGTSANDRIGSYQYNYYQANNSNAFLSESSSITLLSNGNYVVASPMFNGTRGAVTWSSGATGATVDAGHTITATNSLLGSNTADFIGGFMGPNDVITNAGNHTVTHYDSISTGVTALSNGNYVTISNYWRNGAALRAGAVTWSDGAGTPTIGPVSASNSLVGTVQDDMAGLAKNNTYGLTLLQSGYDSAGNISYSGNYVVTSNKWDNGSIVDAGAVTWGSGTAALSGAISDSNSVPGLKTDDVKEWGLTALPVNGNYLIQNQYWNNGAAIGAGALTWVDGSSGRLLDHAAQGNHNIVSGANSLVGSHSGDNVGNTVDYLYNLDATTGQQRFTGNYVALSYNWTNDTRQYAGAVTWGNGATGVKGVITRANSLIGEKENDALGAYYVALTNGNFVVANPTLDVGGVVNAGAVSWVDGSTGRLNDYAAQGNQNIMSGANALVGSHTNDYVGGILSPVVNYTSNPADYGNTGYFIMSPDWNCSAGAVNYISDASVPLIGVVGAGNAAVGNPNSRFWGGLTYNPNISLTSGGAATVTFTGDNGHVVLLSTTMPTPGAMTLPGATQFGDAQGATQAMTPDYIAGVLKTGTSVTLQANNDIFVKNGIDATGGTAGGALTMQAGRSITVLGDIITGNRDLNLIANDSVANGVKDAYRDAGIATLSMGSNKQGVAARIDAGSGDVSLLIAAGADKTNNMAGSISVNSITARTIKLINQGNGAGTVGDLPNLAANCCGFDLGYRGIGADVTLNAGAVLSASGSGDAVTLAAKGNFNNNSGNGAGSIAMSDPAARWLVYANAPGGSTYGGLDSQNTAIWNATYTGTPVTQTGNRYVFAYQPTITVGTQDVSKTYGEDLTTGTTLVDRVVSLSGGQTAQAGAYLADTVATALSGTITATSSGAAANAGVAGGPYAITVNLSGATGNNGYAVALGSNTARTITVQAKTLTAALTGVTKTYDGSTTANLGAANYSLTGLVGADAFNVTKSTAVYNLSGTGASSASTTLAGGDFSAANGSLSSNYILPTSASGAASITPKALTAALTGVTKTYDGTTSAALSGANYQLSGFVGAESATVSQAAGQYNSANVVGASSVSASLAVPDFTAGASTSLANYVLPTTATGAATITAKALTASLTGAIVKAYDGGLTAVLNPGNYSLNGFIAGESGGITQTAALYNSANVAGATTVTANLSSSDLVAGASTLASNYSLPASASGAASITAKALGATISGVGKVYDGGTAAALTGANYQLTGLVGGESASVSQTAGLYNSADVLGANSVSASLSGANFTAGASTSLANYSLPTVATGSAAITPKALAASLTGTISKTYDGSNSALLGAGNFSLTGFVGTQSASVTHTGGVYNAVNVATANSVTASLSAGDFTAGAATTLSNYSLPTVATGSASITAKSLGATISGVSKVYDGGTAAALTGANYQLTGLVVGESASVSQTAGLYNSADVLGANSVSASLSGANFTAGASTSLANYSLPTVATGSAAITPKALAASLTGTISKTYDGSNSALLGAGNFSLTGFVGTQSASVTHTGGVYNAVNVATANSVTASLSAGDFTAGAATTLSNYSLPTVATGSASITAKSLGATISGVSKVYDGGTAAALTGANYQLTGLVAGESASVSQTAGLYNSADVLGANSVSASLSGANFTAGASTSLANYSLPTVATGSAAITPKALGASLSGVGKVYDGSTTAVLNGANYLLTGLVTGESASVSQTAGLYNSADVLGANSVSASLSGANFTAGASTSLANYSLPSVATGSASITAKALSATLSGVGKVYDGSTAATLTGANYQLTGLVAGESASVSQTAGLYNSADVLGANSVSASLSGANFTAGASTSLANYSLPTVATGSAAITAKPLAASLSGVGKVYDGNNSALLGAGNFNLSGFVGTQSASVTHTGGVYNGVNVATANSVTTSLSAGDFTAGAATTLSNYSLPTVATGSASITAKSLGATISGVSKVYDGGTAAALTGANYQLTGLVGGESASVSQTAGLYNSADVLGANSVSASLSGASFTAGASTSLANYSLPTVATGSAAITPKPLAASLTGTISKTYDGGNSALLGAGNFSLTGFVGTQSASVTHTGGVYNAVNVATANSVTASLSAGDFTAGAATTLSNYSLPTVATGSASITAKALGATLTGALGRSYDGTALASLTGSNFVLSGLAAGESINVAPLNGSYDSRNAGTRTVSATLAGSDFTAGSGTVLGNYVLPTSAAGTAVITPKAITLSAPVVSKVYDGTLAYSASAGDLSTLSAALVQGDTVSGATFSYADKNAGNGSKAVNLTQAQISDGNGGANYSVSLAGNSNSTITPRVLNASATGANRVYDTSTNASVSLIDDRIAGDVLTLSNSSASFADKNAGSNKLVTVSGIAAGGADAGNYTLASGTATTTASITPATLQVTGVSAQDRAYDTSLAAGLSGTAVVTALGSDIVKVTGTGIGQFLDKNAGSGKAITVTGYASSDSNYVLAQPTGLSATVTPAVLALSGLNPGVSKTYDGSTRVTITGAPTVSGFGNEVVTVGGVGSGQFADKNAGTGKTITVSGLTASDSNYAIGQQAGLTGTIAPAQLTLAPVTAATRSYDGTSNAQINAASYAFTGLVSGDSVNVVKTTGSFDSRNAGNRTVSIGLAAGDYTAGNGTVLANYLLPTLATGSGVITAKTIVLNAPSISKVYDGTLAYSASAGDLSALSAALVQGDTVSGAAFSYADKNAGNGNKAVNLTQAQISDGNGGANYSVTLAGNSNSTITPRVLNASATGANRVYDTSTNASVSLIDDRIAGDVLTLSNTAASFADKNAGSNKAVTVSGIAAGGADAGNYTLASSTATTTASITPATLQVTGVTAQDRAYDTSLVAGLSGTAVVTALGSDIVKVTGTGIGQFLDKNAGSGKAITVTGYTSSDSNYVLAQPTGLSATVTPAVLALSGLNPGVSKTYDGSSRVTITGAPTVSGFGNEVVTVGGTGSGQFADKNAGTGKTITVSGLSASDSNYAIGQQAGLTGTIAPAQLTLAPVTAATRSYDGTSAAQINAASYAFTGLVSGDSVNVVKTTGSFDSRNAGNRTVSIGLAAGDYTAGNGTVLANYLLPTLATGSGVITAKTITLNAPSISKVYDGTLAYSASAGDLSALSAALVQGDTVSGAAFSYADKNAGNGNKAVNLTQAQISDGNGGANYSVTLAGNSNSTITPRVLNASATGANRVYDTSTNASVSLIDDRIAGDVLTLSNSSASFADKNAGSNKAVTVSGIAAGGADAGNYTLASGTATTTASITPATLQVTGVSAQDRAYDTSLAAGLSGTAVVTALGSDIVKVTGTGIGQFLDKNAGSGKAITVTGYASSDSNYVLAQPTGLSATVTPAVLALSGLNPGVSKTYDGSTRVTITGAPTVSGFGNEVVTVGGVGSGQFADKNAGTGKTITVSGLTASDSNYAIGQQAGLTGTIAPAQLTLAPVTAATRSYDGTSNAQINAASYAFTGLVNGESVTVNKTAGTFDSRNAGNRSVSIGLAAGDYTAGNGTVLANYLLPTLATGSGVITAKTIVLNAPSISKVYDGTLAYSASAGDLSALSAALVQGDTVSGAAFSYADKNAGNGNKAVNLTQAQISDGNGGANYSVTLAGNSNSTITPRVLNASATGANRVYDTSTNASVSLIDDRIAGDVLTLSNTAASFADKNAGSNKVVTVSGIAAGGADAGNYTLASGTATTTASITPATLQVTGVSVLQRSYDRSLNAVLGGAPTVTALGTDVVSVVGTASGSYADKNVGSGKAVTVNGYRSSDSNYVLLQPTGLTGTVTPAVLQVSGLTLAAAKTYDGTRNVTLSGTASVTGLDGEVVTVGGNGSGQFADKNVGTGKVITLVGYTASDSNYAIGQEPGLVGSITPAAITVTGVRANGKSFDGNTSATLSGVGAINVIGADVVTLGGTASASFADATAGTAKPVTVSGYALAGADAGNYALRQPQGLSADIADTAVQVPPPAVVTPPPLPSLPLAAQRAAPGLSMPPLGNLPGTGTGLSSAAPAATPAPSSAAPAPSSATSATTPAPASATPAPSSAASAATPAPASDTPAPSSAASAATPAPASDTPAATPAPASATPAAQANTAGITVALVRPPSLQQGGAITVSVPKQIVDAGNGFGFPLPAQVVEAAAVNRVPVQAQLADGSALPSWISYNTDSKSFVVTQVPGGALPVQIVLVIGAQRTTMVVAER